MLSSNFIFSPYLGICKTCFLSECWPRCWWIMGAGHYCPLFVAWVTTLFPCPSYLSKINTLMSSYCKCSLKFDKITLQNKVNSTIMFVSTVFFPFSTLNNSAAFWFPQETPCSELSMSVGSIWLKALYGHSVGLQTYIKAPLLGPDAVPKPPVALLCLPKRVLPFIWLIWIPTWETSDELAELLLYTTRLLINHSNFTRCPGSAGLGT